MSKTKDDMKPEYDFSGGVRGKHFRAYQQGVNTVLLDSDVATHFKDSESVNQALRLLIQLAGKELGGSRQEQQGV